MIDRSSIRPALALVANADSAATEKLAGRLQAELKYGDISDILNSNDENVDYNLIEKFDKKYDKETNSKILVVIYYYYYY